MNGAGWACLNDSVFATQRISMLELATRLRVDVGLKRQSVLVELLDHFIARLDPEVGDGQKVTLSHLDEIAHQHLASQMRVVTSLPDPVAHQAVAGSLTQVKFIDLRVEDGCDGLKIQVDHGTRLRTAVRITLLVGISKRCFQQFVDVRIGIGGRRAHMDSPKLFGAVLIFPALRYDQTGCPKRSFVL